MLAGLSAVAGSALVGGALPLAAQDKPVVGLRYQNFKRGTIHSLDPDFGTFYGPTTDAAGFYRAEGVVVGADGPARDQPVGDLQHRSPDETERPVEAHPAIVVAELVPESSVGQQLVEPGPLGRRHRVAEGRLRIGRRPLRGGALV